MHQRHSQRVVTLLLPFKNNHKVTRSIACACKDARAHAPESARVYCFGLTLRDQQRSYHLKVRHPAGVTLCKMCEYHCSIISNSLPCHITHTQHTHTWVQRVSDSRNDRVFLITHQDGFDSVLCASDQCHGAVPAATWFCLICSGSWVAGGTPGELQWHSLSLSPSTTPCTPLSLTSPRTVLFQWPVLACHQH